MTRNGILFFHPHVIYRRFVISLIKLTVPRFASQDFRTSKELNCTMASTGHQSFVKITVDQLGVALIEICRPAKRNALSQSVIDDLISAIHNVEKNDEVRAVILTGSAPNGPFSGTYKLWAEELRPAIVIWNVVYGNEGSVRPEGPYRSVLIGTSWSGP